MAKNKRKRKITCDEKLNTTYILIVYISSRVDGFSLSKFEKNVEVFIKPIKHTFAWMIG